MKYGVGRGVHCWVVWTWSMLCLGFCVKQMGYCTCLGSIFRLLGRAPLLGTFWNMAHNYSGNKCMLGWAPCLVGQAPVLEKLLDMLNVLRQELGLWLTEHLDELWFLRDFKNHFSSSYKYHKFLSLTQWKALN